MRLYKDYDWNSLLKGRDAFLLLADLGFINGYECKELELINEEIDIRYKERITI